MSESFAWKAESTEGRSLTGTLDSPDPIAAGRELERLGLRVLEISPAAPRPAKPLSPDDFHAFNLQLAQLTAAGLPLENGLRLVARDIGRGRLARVIDEVAADLENGVPLAQAFDARRGRFPMLYGRLLDAGVRMGNLPGILLSLGEHLQLVQRLRATLWHVLSYPLTVLVALTLVVLLIQVYIQPQMTQLWTDFKVEVPLVGLATVQLLNIAPWLLGGVLAVVLIYLLTGVILRSLGRGQNFIDYLVLPIPLIGPIVRRSLLSRWCYTVALAVEAQQDLPAALSLASDAIGSPRIARDSHLLETALSTGQNLEHVAGLHILPGTVPAALQLGCSTGNLATIMRNLAGLYQRQAEYRAQALPSILTPILITVMGLFVAICVVALFAPMVALLKAISGN